MRPRDKGKFKASIMFPMYTYTHSYKYIYMISIKTLKQLPSVLAKRKKLQNACYLCHLLYKIIC